MRIVYFIILFTFVCNYAKNQGLTNSLDNISHENLLDNPWFTVNQRGQSSYTDPGNGKYTVDRWKIYNYNTLTVSSNGVSSIELYQYFEEDRVKPLLGKTVTLSILLQDGRIRYSSGQLPNAFPSVDTAYIETNVGDNIWLYIILTSSKLLQVQIRNWSDQVIDVRAVKLEFGSISTLAMDTAPNYQQELAKCQRYYEQNSWYSWNVKANLDGVIDVMTSYPFLVKKRVNNITTNILKQNIGNGQLVDLTTSTSIPSNEVTISQPMAFNSRMESIKITHNSIISGHTYYFSIGDDCIAFSADL